MFIPKRDKTDNIYQRMQEQTLERLQELSGQIWTDYNAHDPGVTIADYMNYALFEMQYKLDLPFETYLGTTLARFEDSGIFSARKIFAPSVVTTSDYEQLIIQEIAEVETCSVTIHNGRYHIQFSLESHLKEVAPEAVREQVIALFHRNRNLCEDLASVEIIGKLPRRRKRSLITDRPQHGPETPERILLEMRPPNTYESFQYEFPENYGVGPRGISGEAPDNFRIQVLQLKAYLLIADFMMADVATQVHHTGELLRLSDQVPTGKLPWVEIPDIDKLVDRTTFRDNKPLHDDQFLQEQKSRFMDLLDTLYGEDTAAYTYKYRNTAFRNEQRSLLIRALPDLNANRFRSFNILDQRETMPAVKQLIAALLGHDSDREIPVQALLDRFGLQLLTDEHFFEQYDVYLNFNALAGVFYEPIFNDEPEEVPVEKVVWEDYYLDELKRYITLLRRNALFESFLLVGSNPANYRLMHLTETDRYLLLFNYPEKNEWMIMGVFQDKAKLITAVNRFWAFVRQLNPERQLFYIVEHILLRSYADAPEEDESHRLSIVVSGRFKNDAEQKVLEELLRERLPAHLEVKIFRVQSDFLYAFEQIYYKWRQALAQRDERQITHFSESIRAFFRVSRDYVKNI